MEALGAGVARVRTAGAPVSRPAAGAAFPALAKRLPYAVTAATAAILKSFIFPSFESILRAGKSPPADGPIWAALYDSDVSFGLACAYNIGAGEPSPRLIGGNIACDIVRLGSPPVRFAAIVALVAQRRQEKTPLMDWPNHEERMRG
jgi:hypothetical protein